MHVAANVDRVTRAVPRIALVSMASDLQRMLIKPINQGIAIVRGMLQVPPPTSPFFPVVLDPASDAAMFYITHRLSA